MVSEHQACDDIGIGFNLKKRKEKCIHLWRSLSDERTENKLITIYDSYKFEQQNDRIKFPYDKENIKMKIGERFLFKINFIELLIFFFHYN